MSIQKEITVEPQSGYLAVAILVPLLAIAVWLFYLAFAQSKLVYGLLAVLVVASVVVGSAGLFLVNPNRARVLQLFGEYVGSVKAPGLKWANPLYSKRSVSLRVRNFESGMLKVNDFAGNPIEIATIVVWRVIDTAEALFEVDDYVQYVTIQSESALRNLATNYPYEHPEEGQLSLRTDPQKISDALRNEIQDRLSQAGVEVIEARISHLAYAPEIASAMLRRQQASAVIAARSQIVTGAVSMVHMALEQLQQEGMLNLDEERKASMVSNLLVVLCGEQEAKPVVNAGTLYS